MGGTKQAPGHGNGNQLSNSHESSSYQHWQLVYSVHPAHSFVSSFYQWSTNSTSSAWEVMLEAQNCMKNWEKRCSFMNFARIPVIQSFGIDSGIDFHPYMCGVWDAFSYFLLRHASTDMHVHLGLVWCWCEVTMLQSVVMSCLHMSWHYIMMSLMTSFSMCTLGL